MSIAETTKPRLVSLDQFRGYTIAGMFLVNFVGGFTVGPFLTKHHNSFCSYADTIMPHFLFAMGFAFRLSFGRRSLEQGTSAAYGRVVRRLVGLGLVALFVFQMDDRLLPQYWIDLAQRGAWNEAWRPFHKNWTQTLFQIALAMIWVTPVIRARPAVRVAYLIASILLQATLYHLFYFEWLYAPVEGHTGGPLGFLAWGIPTLVGTLCCDGIAGAIGRPRLGRMFLAAFSLMGIAYILSCGTRIYDVPPEDVESRKEVLVDEHPVIPAAKAVGTWREKIARGEWSSVLAEPPFVAPPDKAYRKWNYWMMSVKTATPSFMLFNSGFSLFVYLLFYVACDMWGWQLGVFRTLGVNALAGYLIQWPTDEIFTDWVGRASAAWGPALGYSADAAGRNAGALFVIVGFVLFFFTNWLIMRLMEKWNIYLKV